MACNVALNELFDQNRVCGLPFVLTWRYHWSRCHRLSVVMKDLATNLLSVYFELKRDPKNVCHDLRFKLSCGWSSTFDSRTAYKKYQRYSGTFNLFLIEILVSSPDITTD